MNTNTFNKNCHHLDLHSLALFRIFLGLIVFLDCGLRLEEFNLFYSSTPQLFAGSMESFRSIYSGWSLFNILNSNTWSYFLFSLLMISSLFFTFGFKTKTSNFITWTLLISVQSKAPHINFAMDTLLVILLFWGMFLPLAKFLSIDSINSRTDYNSICSISTLAYSLQLAFIYWFSAVSKSDRAWRIDYTAAEMALKLESYSTDFGEYLLKFPGLLKISTGIVIYVEQICPIFFFVAMFNFRLKFMAICILIMFHIGLSMTMHLGLFPFVNIVALIALIPTSTWSKLRSPNSELKTLPQNKYNNVCSLILIAYILVLNILKNSSTPPFKGFIRLAQTLRIRQPWKLFAPHPRKVDYLFQPLEQFHVRRKKDLDEQYPSVRVRTYIENVARTSKGKDINTLILYKNIKHSIITIDKNDEVNEKGSDP